MFWVKKDSKKQCKMMIVRMMDVLPSSEVCWSQLTAYFCQSGCTDNPVYYSPLKRKQFSERNICQLRIPPEGKCHKIYSIHHDVDFINV